MNLKKLLFILFVREKFIPIPGMENYSVSNYGRVRNHKGNIVNYSIDCYGYRRVYLKVHGKKKTLRIHRLVMMAFKGESMLIVDHKDCIKENNMLYNLEYITISENTKRAYKNKLVSLNRSKSVVIQKNKDGTVINKFDSVQHAARELSLNDDCIQKCCSGIFKTAHGYKWEKETL